MPRVVQLLAVLAIIVAVGVVFSGAGEPEPTVIATDATGFPLDWPIAVPPGSVAGCANGEVSQQDALFSVVVCLPADPDPLTASENYLATLARSGFAEREPGAFATQQQTFLDGNGIEIFFQLIGDEATIVLIKPGS